MPDKKINKVIYGGNVLLDLTIDDVSASDVLSGKKFHLPDGNASTGTCNYDAYTGDADATASEILINKTAYKNGSKLTGIMPNNGSVTGTITTKAGQYTVPVGYHDGAGKVGIDAIEQSKLVPNNIRENVTILGVTGTMSGSEGIKSTSVNVTPYTTSKTIIPSDLGDFNSIVQVNVAAIAYSESDNLAGGKTATIGSVAPSV